MCCKSFWKTTLPFATALMLGILAASLFQTLSYPVENLTVPRVVETKIRTGSETIASSGQVEIDFKPRVGTNPLQVISKPRPNYTAAARENAVSGTVTLRVTFLASGQIGSISPVRDLPHGLTEEAIKAAQNIRFQPATVEGKAVTVSKLVEYSFAIY